MTGQRPGLDEAIEVAASADDWRAGYWMAGLVLDAAYPIIAAAVLAEAERRVRERPDLLMRPENMIAALRAELTS